MELSFLPLTFPPGRKAYQNRGDAVPQTYPKKGGWGEQRVDCDGKETLYLHLSS
jgi:hypothetical protein